MDSKNFKRNGAKLMNTKLGRCSSLGWFKEDGGIPEWLLIELLIRLPVKSLFRFKIVSKEWLATISDPCFFRTYASRSSDHQRWAIVTSSMLMNGYKEKFPSMEHELLAESCGKPSLFVLPLSCEQNPLESDTIYGVSNGLVLYCTSRTRHSNLRDIVHRYYIYNAVTRHRIALPPLESYCRIYGWGFLAQVEDGFLKSYRVVLNLPKTFVGSSNILFQVYVSERGEWEEVIMRNRHIALTHANAAVTLNGILHWIAPYHDALPYSPYQRPDQLIRGVIAYDPYQSPDRIRTIACDFPMRKDRYTLLVDYRGKLGYFQAFPDFQFWVLNDYDSDSGDWCLLLRLGYDDIQYGANFPCLRSNFEIICFHPFDPEIVYLSCDRICVSYNVKTRKLQVEEEFFRHGGSIYERMHGHWQRAFPLVVPPWPISVANPYCGVIEG